MCMSVWEKVHCRCLQSSEEGPLELETQAVVSLLSWMLGAELCVLCKSSMCL